MKDRLQNALYTLDELERSERSESPLHTVDPRAKLVVTTVFLVTMLSVPLQRLSELLLYFVFPLVLSSAGGLSYGRLFRRSLFVLPFVALVGLFNVFYDRTPVFYVGPVAVTEGWIGFASILLRGLLSVQALLLLVRTTGYYRLCRSMQRMGMPSLFAAQLLFVFRYLRVLLEECFRMRRARDARGYGRASYPLPMWGTFVGELMIRTFDRSESVYRAMLARGFTGRIPDCSVREESRWRFRDSAFVALWCAAFVFMRLCGPVETFVRTLGGPSSFH